MRRSVMQIGVGICRFNIEGCVCSVFGINFDSGVKIINIRVRVVAGEFDGGVTGIQICYEFLEICFCIGPDTENIVYVPPPYYWK